MSLMKGTTMEPRERRTQAAPQRAREELPSGMAPPTGNAPGSLTSEAGHFVLGEIERSGSLPAGVAASQAFATVIGALLRRLPPDAAGDFVQRHLPNALRTLVDDVPEQRDEGDAAGGDVSEYLAQVADDLQVDRTQTEETVRAVIAALRLLMSGEEVDAIAAELPPGLEALWRDASNVPGAPGHSGLP
jgi:uncharacterized protein (DUF2267 family)